MGVLVFMETEAVARFYCERLAENAIFVCAAFQNI